MFFTEETQCSLLDGKLPRIMLGNNLALLRSSHTSEDEITLAACLQSNFKLY